MTILKKALYQVLWIVVIMTGLHFWQVRDMHSVETALSENWISTYEMQQWNPQTQSLLKTGIPDSKWLQPGYVLYFFASWCGVCEYTSPQIASVYKSWNASTVSSTPQIIGIAVDYQKNELENYLKSKNMNFPVLIANDKTYEEFAINSFPSVYFVDGDHQIQGRSVGFISSIGIKLRTMLFL